MIDKTAGLTRLKLAKLPNREQAYCIRPVGDNRLVLTALDEAGVYYAVQTLRQLLESKFDKGSVTIPLVSVTDWPDMPERGGWRFSLYGWYNTLIERMGAHKINMFEENPGFSVTENKPLKIQLSRLTPERIEFGRRHAFKLIPFFAHIDEVFHSSGVYEVYPELQAVNQETAGVNEELLGETIERALCPSQQDRLIEVLAQSMCAFAGYKGVNDIDCWLTESGYECCKCAKCVVDGKPLHWILEARALVKAWRIARKQYPDLKIRIALTNGSYPYNRDVLAEIPPEVGVGYYHCSKTYNSWRDPMIYPLLEEYAAKGNWLSVIPSITASVNMISPWSAPQFIKYRMNEFVNKNLKSVCVFRKFCIPDSRLYDFNITAVAEWLWNSQGRDEHEFTAAWATRRGYKDPDAIADWADMLGPVSWDVYGSGIPAYRLIKGRRDWVVDEIAKRTQPKLGRGIFRCFPTEEHIDNDLETCRKALALATRLDLPELIHETRVIHGYVGMVKEMYFIAKQASILENPVYADRLELQKALARLATAALEARNATREWYYLMVGRAGVTKMQGRAGWALTYIDDTVLGLADILESSFGVPNFIKPYFGNRFGEWTKEDFGDFEDEAKITRKWEITGNLARTAPCRMELEFRGTSGGQLDIFRVALASSPADKPDHLTELSADKHEGSTYYDTVVRNVYAVTLETYEPGLRYFIVTDVKGNKHSNGCQGYASIRTLIPESRYLNKIAESFLPLSDEEFRMLVPRKPQQKKTVKFTGSGLRVGVAEKCWGGTPILADLRAIKGIDAQSLPWPPDKEMINACRVIVLPQPQDISNDSLVKMLEDFVRAGGGLITTHDAVGYREQPPILTNICLKGTAHVRDRQWIVTAEHPVTQGIDLRKSLSHSYYDHVEMEPGPDGVILAVAAQSRRPVVIAGACGKGRYVACGLEPGIAGVVNKEVALAGAEKILLENAVKWCGDQ